MHRTRLLYFGTGYGAGAVVCNPVVMQQGKQKQIKQNLLPPPLPASKSSAYFRLFIFIFRCMRSWVLSSAVLTSPFLNDAMS
jgi:hypothetical protein